MVEGENKDIITPFKIEAGEVGVDYERLIEQFGCERMTPDHVRMFEEVTGHKPHRLLRRGIYFAHRDLDLILNTFRSGKTFFLYTGRGPSSSALHLGHMVPFIFCKWLQDVFNVPCVVQITDDEKYLYRPELSLEEVSVYARENIRDIIACGFDINKTFIFKDTDYIQHLYPNMIKMQKHITVNQIRGIFGFDGSANVGMVAYPPLQAVPCFSNSFPQIFGSRTDVPCLIPDAIDQDPYFRMTRDVAPRIGYLKPAVIHAKFFPALQGLNTKMSSSENTTAVFLTDTQDEIKQKITRNAFSGGGRTKEEHQRLGANLAVDVPFQYLTFFLEDDEKLEEIRREYGAGRMMTSQVKRELIEILQQLVAEHQRKRALVTDEIIDEFMRPRKLEFSFSN
jgi:tryptophanyl-tRNA synthetase